MYSFEAIFVVKLKTKRCHNQSVFIETNHHPYRQKVTYFTQYSHFIRSELG